MKNIDITGQKFGKLTAIEKVRWERGGTVWRFACDCGTIIERRRCNVVHGTSGSCGCGYRKNRHIAPGYKMGMLIMVRLEKVEPGKQKNAYYRWHVKCDCGVERTFRLSHILRMDKDKYDLTSCGCQTNRLKSETRTEHGMAPRGKPRETRYSMWCASKQRSRDQSIPFDLGVDDIPEIPDFCPLLEIPLAARQGKNGQKSDFSPSIDRIIPALGYVKGNVQIISNKANRIKNDASFDEFEKVYFNWKAQNIALRLAQGDEK